VGFTLAASMTPVGAVYLVGSSSGSEVQVDTRAIKNLNLALFASNGTTMLANANTQPAGSAETISGFNLAAGTYLLRVNNASGSVNDVQRYTLALTLSGGCVPPTVTQHPVGDTVCAAGSASFSAAGVGTAPLSYQWRRNGVDLAGATGETYAVGIAGTNNAGTYDCVISNACGSATTSGALLTVNIPPQVTLAPTAQSACPGGSATFSAGFSGSPAPALRWQKDGVDIPGATGGTLVISGAGPGDVATYRCVATNTCGSANSPGAGLTLGAGPTITGHPGGATVCVGAPASFSASASGAGLSYQWRRQGVGIGGATGPTYSIGAVSAGQAGDYDCVITNACGSATTNAATLVVNAGPAFTLGPTPVTACAGQSASMTVAVSGAGPIALQWRRNSVNINGATGATLDLGTLSAASEGTYDCVATNACGSSTSASAGVTVQAGPVFAGGGGGTLDACAGETVQLSASASGNPAPTLQWFKGAGAIPGATSGVLTLAGVTALDSGTYTCRAENACGSATSEATVLSVGESCCDPDVNQDGAVDQGDVDYLVNVVGGGDNPTGIDPDFNGDGATDQSDIDALVNVVGGGACP
jgi:hypothetical protein